MKYLWSLPQPFRRSAFEPGIRATDKNNANRVNSCNGPNWPKAAGRARETPIKTKRENAFAKLEGKKVIINFHSLRVETERSAPGPGAWRRDAAAPPATGATEARLAKAGGGVGGGGAGVLRGRRLLDGDAGKTRGRVTPNFYTSKKGRSEIREVVPRSDSVHDGPNLQNRLARLDNGFLG